jgi:uncharacterized protein (DUF1697 family)
MTGKNVTHVALLRGINVAGKNMLPMKDLAKMFTDAGCTNVRTYIQSGNVIFESLASPLKMVEGITGKIEKGYGYRIPMVLRTSEQLLKTIRDNPFLKGGADEKWLHVYFLADAPKAVAIAGLDANRCPPDAFHVRGQEIYLHVPNGMARTKLTNAYFDSKLSTICTARNWATVLRLAAMMQAH